MSWLQFVPYLTIEEVSELETLKTDRKKMKQKLLSYSPLKCMHALLTIAVNEFHEKLNINYPVKSDELLHSVLVVAIQTNNTLFKHLVFDLDVRYYLNQPCDDGRGEKLAQKVWQGILYKEP